ncbi:hypothetical protein [Aliiroseovarius sp. 2305UL8-7]|uniref:hypothetical protein n=1 Tax=Aliiroseovarius conchicola TaxID=3121637 RepID=UPI003527A887
MPMRSLVLILLIAVASFLAPTKPANAQSNVVSGALPGAELRGNAVLRFLGIPLYQARLFTVGGAPFNWADDFALELTYKRNLTQYDLVEATMREFKRTGGRIPVDAQLNTCFKAVNKGDSYLAVTNGTDKIDFWRNGARTCTLRYPQIKSRFMGIFLGDNTRSKSFTRTLKGQ